MFSLLFSEAGVSLLCFFFISTLRSPISLINIVPWLSWLSDKLPFFSIWTSCLFHLSLSACTWFCQAGHMKHQRPLAMLIYGGSSGGRAEVQRHVGQEVQKCWRILNISLLYCTACNDRGLLSTVQNPYYIFKALIIPSGIARDATCCRVMLHCVVVRVWTHLECYPWSNLHTPRWLGEFHLIWDLWISEFHSNINMQEWVLWCKWQEQIEFPCGLKTWWE